MTDRKAQHQLRARLVREGTRTLALSAITDYRAAKPTHKPKPTQTMTVTAKDGTTATIEVTDVKVSYDSPSSGRSEVGRAMVEGFARGMARSGYPNAYATATTYAEAIAHATTPKPLPSPDTREGLLARLNARHHSTRPA